MGEMPCRRRPTTSLVVTLLVVLALVGGCTADGDAPSPSPTADSPERAATELADGLARADLEGAEFVGASSAEVNTRFQALVAGMGPLRPEVGVASLGVRGSEAEATLRFTWTFPGVPTSWVYDTSAELIRDGGRWKPVWQPSIVQPGLDGGNRLTQRRLYPDRGELLGEDGDPIVTLRAVIRIGLDKARVKPEQAESSARRLADLVDIDPDGYLAEVSGAGPQAFVEAIVFRAGDDRRPSDAQVARVPGALALEDQQMLAPTPGFARPVIGTVGEATKEIVDASGGAVVAGDQVGLTGLQRRYDVSLRGTPGVRVRLVPASPPSPSASPPGSAGSPVRPSGPAASPSSLAAPSDAPAQTASARPAETLFESEPVAGEDLTVTLNLGLQRVAESVLANTKPASALVAIRPSTGALLAIANGPGTEGQSVATVGQFPPGSTFKVASTLALLRAGLRPDSTLDCPRTVTVDGRDFENYDDYPAGALGRIDLRTALAQSCNTAFIGQRDQLSDQALAEAAGSLGLGVDYDVGFPAYFGEVPPPASETERAAALIGQGKVQSSPLAMAAAAGSVAAGRTVIPHLIADSPTPKSQAKPLTGAEARQLRSMMRAVVTEGSGSRLADLDPPAVIAKTGTAEYGTRQPPRTHAWTIAAQGDLAVAVFVADGASGSRTAGPLLERFLREAS